MRIAQLVAEAIEEDLGNGDVTTESIIDPQSISTGYILSKQELVVSGQTAATEVFRQLGVEYTTHFGDGSVVPSHTIIGQATGSSVKVLIGERIALNFLMRLSGIATHTHRTLRAVQDRSFKVVDTRKTTPLHRQLERRAVVHGGGSNHRHALYDGILIKDNHITAAGGIEAAIQRAQAHAHHLLKIEVEVETLEQAIAAVSAGADALLLDNMSNQQLAAVVDKVRAMEPQLGNKIVLEASGNMDQDRLISLRDQAIDIDIVSMGGLIHQARWADLSMKFDLSEYRKLH